MAQRFVEELRSVPFKNYDEYMLYLFACVNTCLDAHLGDLKKVLATDQGGYKSALYPDIEIAHDVAREHIAKFYAEEELSTDIDEEELEDSPQDEEMLDDLMDLLSAFSSGLDEDESSNEVQYSSDDKEAIKEAEDMIAYIQDRAEITVTKGISLPFYNICKRQKFDNFTVFCLVCAILSSTQTDYASVFQIVNENGNLATPTIESAARLYYGHKYSITGAYGDMSVCLEQLSPILFLKVVPSMPFSTSVSPDKRIIDYLFGKNHMKLDESYSRYIKMLTDDKDLDPILANDTVLEAMEISYDEGCKLFSYVGDEGSGRKFFVKHFCRKRNMNAITVNCKKLFGTDYSFVDQALWALARECILTDSCVCMEELSYREEEKERFFTFLDMAFSKLLEKGILVFAFSKDKINYKEVTRESITTLELATPNIDERIKCWEHFGAIYSLGEDVDIFEMAVKFLFTPGKIADALKYARNLSVMDKEKSISRDKLFKGCNAQMSSELSQKATRVEAKFGFEDIVMNADQRETIEHAIEQMMYKNKVYEDWNYTRKYPYGRGLTVLLFGAPGTGKSMMAQVLAHELNLELYRIDISKVVDKYVGETEKALSMIFREAKKCNVVLFFDECDTIFAKRTDDGGSNQSSNNNKTALLLQEMEAYDGVCVLATNYKHNIDPAFFRRMKYIVEFQFPDPDTREMLWSTTIPKTTPLSDDVDIRFLAEKFEFAGGNIKNCILNAAFLAAADKTNEDSMVHMKHYLRAIKYEYVKTGKVFTRSDFEPYADDVFGKRNED